MADLTTAGAPTSKDQIKNNIFGKDATLLIAHALRLLVIRSK